MAERKMRVMIAKPGLDGHDRGREYWPGVFAMPVLK